MRMQNWRWWAGLLTGSAVLLQFGGCNWDDFWVRLAGVGAISSGLINLFSA